MFTYFRIETAAGDEIAELLGLTEDEAVQDAKTRLAEDPEMGSLEVVRVVEEHVWTITNAPTNTLGDSAIVALRPGEPIPNPGYSVRVPDETTDEQEAAFRESFGYAIDDPKHPAYHENVVGIFDNRDKTAGV